MRVHFVPVGFSVWEAAMARERVRERIGGMPTPDYFRVRADAGWKLVAVESARESDSPPPGEEEVPYGIRVPSDCAHLDYDTGEMPVMTPIIGPITQAHSVGRLAHALNRP